MVLKPERLNQSAAAACFKGRKYSGGWAAMAAGSRQAFMRRSRPGRLRRLQNIRFSARAATRITNHQLVKTRSRWKIRISETMSAG